MVLCNVKTTAVLIVHQLLYIHQRKHDSKESGTPLNSFSWKISVLHVAYTAVGCWQHHTLVTYRVCCYRPQLRRICGFLVLSSIILFTYAFITMYLNVQNTQPGRVPNLSNQSPARTIVYGQEKSRYNVFLINRSVKVEQIVDPKIWSSVF